jgi:hypothetical protein
MKTLNSNSKPITFFEKKRGQNSDFSNKVKELTKETLYNSLAQAIIKIPETPHIFLKVFLFIFVCIACGLASFLIIQSISEYLSYQVTTTSRTIYENPTLFPKISFCNINKYATKYAYYLTKNISYNELSLNIEEKKLLGHEFNNIALNCWFNFKKCTSRDFVWFFDSTYGNCFTFNSGLDSNKTTVDLKQSSFVGSYFGLQLTLYVNIYEKLLKSNFSNPRRGMGVMIRIENNSFSNTYGNDDIFVSTGFQTDILLSREVKSILPKPYSDCEIEEGSKYFSSEFFDLITNSKYIYTQQLCLLQCSIQKPLIQKCNCSSSNFVSLYNKSVCNYNSYCHNEFFLNDYKDRLVMECIEKCPLECYHSFFKRSISSYQLLGNVYVDMLEKQFKRDFIRRKNDSTMAKESIVQVYIYYDKLSYSFSSETPQMSIASLLAYIGGNLGLLLGVSIFSVCEIVEVLIEIYYLKREIKIQPHSLQ